MVSLLCCRFLLSVITSLVKKDPPELEAVLSKIKRMKGTKLRTMTDFVTITVPSMCVCVCVCVSSDKDTSVTSVGLC